MIGSMHFSIDRGEPNVGREDRFVRSGLALSLLLLGMFPLASQRLSVIGLVFILVSGYFAVTAGLGWDPLYRRHGIDTRVAGARVVDLTAGEADRPAGDLSSLWDR